MPQNFKDNNFPLRVTTLDFCEACNYLKISKSSLYKLTSQKKISFNKPNGGKVYFEMKDLDNWLKRNKVNSTHEIQEEITAKIFKNGK